MKAEEKEKDDCCGGCPCELLSCPRRLDCPSCIEYHRVHGGKPVCKQ